jgi:ADP-ribose pyrophosphatase YjhB (NUDIX family)
MPGRKRMNYCSDCGGSIVLEVPRGDSFPRHVCSACGTIHYKNPLVVVGCIPEWEGKLLLCKRAIEPRLGYWTAPAGFMELGETLEEGAARETLEEACARVKIGSMLAAVSVRHVNQVHIMYRAKLLDGEFAAGAESVEVRLFSPDEIPWDDLAFRSVIVSLKALLADPDGGVHSYAF